MFDKSDLVDFIKLTTNYLFAGEANWSELGKNLKHESFIAWMIPFVESILTILQIVSLKLKESLKSTQKSAKQILPIDSDLHI